MASDQEPPPDASGTEIPVAGVSALDHTADVGLELRAPDLGELVRRAVLGMDHLLREAGPPAVAESRALRVRAEDPASLLRSALREVLFWHATEGFAPSDVRVHRVSARDLEADVPGGFPREAPVREIKGVTRHELKAEPTGAGWAGRVIFDV